MTSVSADHIILTPTKPVGSGRPQQESNPGPPHQESRALPTELPRPHAPPPLPHRVPSTHRRRDAWTPPMSQLLCHRPPPSWWACLRSNRPRQRAAREEPSAWTCGYPDQRCAGHPSQGRTASAAPPQRSIWLTRTPSRTCAV